MDKIKNFRTKYFPQINDENWYNWQWQIRNRISNLNEIKTFFNSSIDFDDKLFSNLKIPFAVTPYYAAVCKDNPLELTILPSIKENIVRKLEVLDPLGEEPCFVAPNLVHRYKDRALLLVTNFCPSYCRYCTRGRRAGREDMIMANLDAALTYIENHPEIRDVLISGGDPLILSDEKIESLLTRLRAIKHVEIIRIGTKIPVNLPMRITTELIQILKKHNPVFLSIHINRKEEITDDVSKVFNDLADNGILMGSQTVLLKNINDDAEILLALMHSLLKNRVKPYYLFQCDPIAGSGHFRVPLRKGIDIIDEMRRSTSGYAIPTYAIDIPNRFGKIAVLPNHIQETSEGIIKILNFDGKVYEYPDVG